MAWTGNAHFSFALFPGGPAYSQATRAGFLGGTR